MGKFKSVKKQSKVIKTPSRKAKVMFSCACNTCRSPMMMYYFQQLDSNNEFKVTSAGGKVNKVEWSDDGQPRVKKGTCNFSDQSTISGVAKQALTRTIRGKH